jgi:pyridoxine 5-phosphate synthase
MPRLHVNIDHIATLRQARREAFPDPVAWGLDCLKAGAHGLTLHLRKDRRHIQDADVTRLLESTDALVNLECSLDPEMIGIALESGAGAFCLVPENRAEVTTEGGLDVIGERARLSEAVPALTERGGLVSLFVDPDLDQLDGAREVGAPFVELHTGPYANASGGEREAELARLRRAAEHATSIGLRVNAGHGLDHDNVAPVAALPQMEELNIGFALVARALTCGVDESITSMLRLMDGARHA